MGRQAEVEEVKEEGAGSDSIDLDDERIELMVSEEDEEMISCKASPRKDSSDLKD